MLANRRLWYCTQLTKFLMLHPEDVAEFVTVVCDTIDIITLDAIYEQIKETTKKPNPEKNKAKEN